MPGTVKELAKYRINIFPAVNTLFNALANNPEFAKLDFSGLLISNGGGMAVQEAVARKWLAITGCPIVEGYGLSETSAGVTCNPTDLGGLHRHDRPADAQRRDQDPRRRTARSCRWARPARSRSRGRR